MTSNISTLLGQVQGAIDEAVAQSTRIGNLIAEMKRSGYDLCLVLDSTVTISPTDDRQLGGVPEPQLASNGELKLTDEDVKFLQDLKIYA
jgi:hypothetical protein